MARVIPSVARTIRERDRIYHRGRPVQVEDEELYHHLMRTGRFRDADQTLRPIDPALLRRLAPGSFVTVLREGGLGDVLMVLVVIRALKTAFPAVHFGLATGRQFLPLLTGLGFLAQVEAVMDVRGQRSNVIDLRGLVERDVKRETLDRIDIFAEFCHVAVHDYSVPLAPVGDEARRAARVLIGSRPTIALAVRGSTHVRTWPFQSVRMFAEIAALQGWTVAVLDGSAFDMPEHARIVNLTGKLSLLETKAVIAESDFCVSTDSGLQHVAEAVGTRCLAIYSTTPPALRIGHYRHVKAIWRESLPCVPCFDRGCAAAPCMHVSPALVLRALEGWDQLPLVTDADHAPLPAPAPISIPREAEIMDSWRECPHCR